MIPSRLTVFIDCLGLLLLLSRWGRADFWPGLQDIIHFDVLLPLLRLLRSWTAAVVLVKVKSHSGCYHNDRADECASLGCVSDSPQLFPGPQKYGTLHWACSCESSPPFVILSLKRGPVLLSHLIMYQTRNCYSKYSESTLGEQCAFVTPSLHVT